MLSSLLSLPLANGMSVLLAILGIGFLIFVHELGHYLACRLTRTRVETFSIGFGTRLFGWENRPGEPKRFTIGRRRLDPSEHAMDFRVALVPLGGYVKMAGENPGEERSGSPDEFPSKSLSARVFIVSAGVVMNVITAFVLYLVAYGAHIEQEPAMIGSARVGGPAWEADLRSGDRILSLAGTRTRSFFELKRETVVLTSGRPVTADVQRGESRFDVQVVPRYDEEAGAVLLDISPPKTYTVEAGERRVEVRPMDRVEVEGVPVRGGQDMLLLLRAALKSRQGETRASFRTPDGEVWPLVWKAGEPAPDSKPAYKLGIELVGRPTVDAVRGAAAKQLRVGDRILAVHRGSAREEILTTTMWVALPFDGPVDHLEVERGAERLRLPLEGMTGGALHAWLLDVDVDIPAGLAVRPLAKGTVALEPDGRLHRYPSVPAAAAGLRAGEVIVAIDGEEVSTWREVIEVVRGITSPAPVEMKVRGEDDAVRSLRITPVALQPLEGPTLAEAPYWEPYETEGVLDVAGIALARTGREIQGIFRLIGAFFTGQLSFQKNIGGPVTIVVASSAAVKRNWLHFLIFLAYISITLAVLNILPIPVLDGGHLMFMLIEKVKGSPLSEATIGKLQFAGLMLLLVLMVFAFKNDFGLLFD